MGAGEERFESVSGIAQPEVLATIVSVTFLFFFCYISLSSTLLQQIVHDTLKPWY